jgi:hypothetical protein
MTRRGSLIYYLAAWICGCFFVSLSIWLRDLMGPAVGFFSLRSAFGLLFFYFYGLAFGAVASLLGAFLLRRVAVHWRWKDGWRWAVAGAVLAPLVVAALGSIWRSAAFHQYKLPKLVSFATYGPGVVLEAGVWLAIPSGAATAFVLYCIHRAFDPEARSAQG